MKKPKKKFIEYYECPYCGYSSNSYENIDSHMSKCDYNTDLPEKNCESCKHLYNTVKHDEKFHCDVIHQYCTLNVSFRLYKSHPGYNACYAFERKEN